MCHLINQLVMFYLTDIRHMVPYAAPKKMYYHVFSSELEAARYKFCNLTSFIRPRRKVENVNNISLNFMMFKVQQPNFQELLCYHLFHLTKVSSHINYWIIFDTISTL